LMPQQQLERQLKDSCHHRYQCFRASILNLTQLAFHRIFVKEL
jgi:hypothetical protein